MLSSGAGAFADDRIGSDSAVPCGFTDSGFDTSSDVHALQEYQNAIGARLRQKRFADWTEARANMRTAEGALYQKAVAQKLDFIARSCAEKAGNDRTNWS
jgi:hypothetical protein